MASKYAITEIITSGLNFKIDRIIHISTFRIEDQEIKSHLTTYIDPERALSPEMISSTGITNDNFKFSPKFYEKAKQLLELWTDCSIISSNPRITLSFLKSEFKSLGFDFNPKIGALSEFTDTILPEIENIEDKAYAYASHFLEYGIHKKLKKDFTPRAFLEKEIKLLPNECGIYILKNLNGSIIYVGKALKIRTRLRQHFRNLNNKGFKIHRMVSAIDHKVTNSELFALLIEHHHILKYRPELNKALRNNASKYELRYLPNQAKKIQVLPTGKSNLGHSIKRFKSKKSALAFLLNLILIYGVRVENCEIFGIGEKQLSEKMESWEIEDVEVLDLTTEEVVKHINPFYEGIYIINEKSNPEKQAFIKNGRFMGFNLESKKDFTINLSEENIEYAFQSEYALNLIIKYHRLGLLEITSI